MKYRVSIAGTERDIDVTLSPDGRASVRIGDEPREIDVLQVPGGVSVRLGDRVFDVLVGRDRDGVQVASRAERLVANVQNERALARRSARGSAGRSEKELRAPMPGRVVRVAVREGEVIAAGAPVVVIEAMKMENELRAKAGGTVARVHVREGDTVEGNGVLVTFA